MGKRKSSAKAAPKKKAEPLSTTFKCLFCHHEKAITVKLDKHANFGYLNCKDCGQQFSTPTNALSAAVDVYSDWVDACEEVRLRQPVRQKPPRAPNPLDHGRAGIRLGPAPVDVDDEDADDADGDRTRIKGARRNSNDEDEDEDDDAEIPDLEVGGDTNGNASRKKQRVERDYDSDDDDE